MGDCGPGTPRRVASSRIRFAIAVTVTALFVTSTALGKPTKPSKPTKADKSAKASGETEAAATAVTAWMKLGPLEDALPAFHAEHPDGIEATSLLDAERFGPEPRDPRPRMPEAWFGDGGPRWSVAQVTGGKLLLDPVTPPTPTRPAIAWLAAWVEVGAFREVDFEVQGTRARALWVDGERRAFGASAHDTVEATVALEPGRHLVVVRTLDTGEKNGEWSVGLVYRSASDVAASDFTWSVDAERPLSIEDVVDGVRVRSIAVSPDGRLVALDLARGRAEAEGGSESWIEVRRAADGTTVRTWRGTGPMGRVAWHPTGRKLSYVATSGKRSSVWLVDFDRGSEREVLAGIEEFAGYAWTPTGDALVYTVRASPEPSETGIKRLRGLLDRQRGHRTKSYLHVATYPGGARRRLTSGPVSTDLADLSADGRRALVLRRVEDVTARPYSITEVWEIELRSGDARSLVRDPWIVAARYDPAGEDILFQAGPSAFDGGGAAVPPGVVPNEYDHQLYVWSREDDRVRSITRNFDPAVERAAWNPADGSVYFSAAEGDAVGLFRFDPETDAITAVPVGDLEHVRGFGFARRAPVAVVRGDGAWMPARVHVLDLAAGAVREIARPAEETLGEFARGDVRSFGFTSSEGTAIDGRVYLPVGFDPERRYPVIVHYYGGTSPVSRGFGGRYPAEWWAANGYVVYVPQPSGATGYGQEFSARHVNTWGAVTTAEIVEGTRKFLEAHPFADGDRVGCIGASYGGFTTMKLLTETDRFAAAVAHAGISALSSYWGEGYWGYSYSSIATAESFPWNRRDLYVDRSPLFQADRITTPLLLTHGDADPNVPPGESDQMFVALKLLGAPVEYLSIAGQEHWILEREKRLKWSKSIVAWFDRWLKDEPDWWEHLYPSDPRP